MAFNRYHGNTQNLSIYKLEMQVRKLQKLERDQQPQELISALERRLAALITSFPNEARLYLIQGMLLERLKQNDAALELYKSARFFFPYIYAS